MACALIGFASTSGRATSEADTTQAEAPASQSAFKPATPAVEVPQTAPAQAPAAPLSFRVVSSGRASFLIDAPLEKINGRWTPHTLIQWSSVWEAGGQGTAAFCDPIYRSLIAALQKHFGG